MEDEFLLALEQVGRRFQMRVYAYVVMPEHVQRACERAGEHDPCRRDAIC
jgi:hypothetical protein